MAKGIQAFTVLPVMWRNSSGLFGVSPYQSPGKEVYNRQTGKAREFEIASRGNCEMPCPMRELSSQRTL
jgi:hypothetical protein